LHAAYLGVTIVLAVLAVFSRIGKLRRDPKIVHTIHKVIGVPLQYFLHLAACEFAGAIGLVLGIWWPLLGIAAGAGLAVYFLGAVVSHVRVGDVNGIGPAAVMLIISVAAVALRALAYNTGAAGLSAGWSSRYCF
jgi:hypothetical protein